MTKFLGTVLVALGALGLVILPSLWQAPDESKSMTSKVTSVRPTNVFANGRVEGATAEVKIRARQTGLITRVDVETGQVVRAGDQLLQLDDATLKNELQLDHAVLDEAVARLERIRNGASKQDRDSAMALYLAKLAQLKNATRQLRDAAELRRSDAIAQREVDERGAEVDRLRAEVDAAHANMESISAPARNDELKIAQAQISAAKARVEITRAKLERTRVRALQDGQVLQVNVEPGELAGPNTSTPSFILADTSRLRIAAFVEELDAPKIRVGMNVRITADGLPGRTFEGSVTSVSPRMGRKTVWNDAPAERHDTKTRDVKIELHDSEGLVIGLRVDVIIDMETNDEV